MQQAREGRYRASILNGVLSHPPCVSYMHAFSCLGTYRPGNSCYWMGNAAEAWPGRHGRVTIEENLLMRTEGTNLPKPAVPAGLALLSCRSGM